MSRWFILLSLILLSACGGQPEPSEVPQIPTSTGPVLTPSPTAFVPQETVTIRLGTWAEGAQAAELDNLIADLNAGAVGYRIVHEPEPEAYYTALQIGLAGGSAPDLFWLEPEWMPMLADQSALLDLSPYFQADTFSPAANVMDYFPEILRASVFEGRFYSLPFSSDPVMLYYNTALFDSAGLELPASSWTWADLRRAAAALTVDDDNDGRRDRWGFAMEGEPSPLMFVWQSGGEVVSLDRASVPVDSPEAVRGLEFFSQLLYDPRYAPPVDTLEEETALELFQSGRLGMLAARASLPLETMPEVETGSAPMPAGPAARAVQAWSVGLAIPAAAPHPEQAYAALVQLAEILQARQVVPPRRSLASAEQITENHPGKYASAQALAEAAYQMRAPTGIPRQVEWERLFASELLQPLARQRVPAEELAESARPQLEALLQDPIREDSP